MFVLTKMMISIDSEFCKKNSEMLVLIHGYQLTEVLLAILVLLPNRLFICIIDYFFHPINCFIA